MLSLHFYKMIRTIALFNSNVGIYGNNIFPFIAHKKFAYLVNVTIEGALGNIMLRAKIYSADFLFVEQSVIKTQYNKSFHISSLETALFCTLFEFVL